MADDKELKKTETSDANPSEENEVLGFDLAYDKVQIRMAGENLNTPVPVEEAAISEEEQYPGVDLAYDLTVDSCESIIKRIDVMDGRLQTILAFAATTTAVVPSVANSRGLTFRSNWLYAALGIFIVQLLVGTIARSFGTIKLIRPDVVWNRWLDKDPWLFKKDFIAFGRKHFDHNADLLRRRWRLLLVISFLFFIEVLLLVVWVATAQISRLG